MIPGRAWLGRRLDASHLIHFNQANRDDWVADVAARLAPGTRILDVGAGMCPYRPLFAHCDYRTQDFGQYEGTAEGPTADDWRYGEIDYVSDITEIPVEDESFDAVLCTEAIEHVPDPVAALAEVARIVRPGGRVFLSAPLASGLHQEPFHYYGGYTPHFYRRMLPPLGFEIERIDANGGFFRHLLQELVRAGDLIDERRPYPRWHPAHWVVAVGFRIVAPRWLARLDDEVPVEEFTVGYHVEASKLAAPSGRS